MRFLRSRRFRRIPIAFLAFLVFSIYLLTGKRQGSDCRNGDSVEHTIFNWGDSFQFHCSFGEKTYGDVIPELSKGRVRYDDRRMIRIYDYLLTGTEWERLHLRYDVCLATQTSIEWLYWLPEILEKWTGPLSLAIHLTSSEEWLIFNLYLCYLSQCHPPINQVSMHLAVPTLAPVFKVSENRLHQMNFTRSKLERVHELGKSCPKAKTYLQFLLRTFPTMSRRSLKLKEVYPQNHMRNIARKACGTTWTYSADIDLIPSGDMADKLQNFYTNLEIRGKFCKKCAYVIPVFEMNETYPFPKSKRELNKLYRMGVVRQFHKKTYAFAHQATNYHKWISTNLNEKPTIISHAIDQRFLKPLHHYEPFYVSSDLIIPFDERFMGYGYTRYSQFKAAHIAEWNFTVLTPVFSIHWVLQTMKTQFSPKKDGVGKPVRNVQVSNNTNLFNRYMDEINYKKIIGML